MHVVIAGGGVAGLEALLVLSELAEGLVDVELLSPSDEFVYRPLLVAEPFGAAEVLRVELERVVRDVGARHTKDALTSVEPRSRSIATAEGATLEYGERRPALYAKRCDASAKLRTERTLWPRRRSSAARSGEPSAFGRYPLPRHPAQRTP